MWRRFAEDVTYELENPTAAAARRERDVRTGRSGGGNGPSGRGPRYRENDDAGGIDKAYAREYLQPDQKRARRD